MFNVGSPSAGDIRGPFLSVAGFQARGASSTGTAGPRSAKAGVRKLYFGYNADMVVYANLSSDITKLYAIVSKRVASTDYNT